MSIHIEKFVEKIKASELRGRRDIVMTTAEARDLHGDITKILLLLSEHQKIISNDTQPVRVEIQGGSF